MVKVIGGDPNQKIVKIGADTEARERNRAAYQRTINQKVTEPFGAGAHVLAAIADQLESNGMKANKAEKTALQLGQLKAAGADPLTLSRAASGDYEGAAKWLQTNKEAERRFQRDRSIALEDRDESRSYAEKQAAKKAAAAEAAEKRAFERKVRFERKKLELKKELGIVNSKDYDVITKRDSNNNEVVMRVHIPTGTMQKVGTVDELMKGSAAKKSSGKTAAPADSGVTMGIPTSPVDPNYPSDAPLVGRPAPTPPAAGVMDAGVMPTTPEAVTAASSEQPPAAAPQQPAAAPAQKGPELIRDPNVGDVPFDRREAAKQNVKRVADAAKARGENADVAQAEYKASEVTLGEVDQALDVMTEVGGIVFDAKEGTSSWAPNATVGTGGRVMSAVPWATRAQNLRGMLEESEALAAFAKLKELKAASKTGASGLGQVTEREINLLISSFKKLDPSMTEERFIRQWGLYVNKLQNLRNKIEAGRNEYLEKYEPNKAAETAPKYKVRRVK